VQDLNKEVLKGTAAGMRLIAQTTIYNSGDLSRLRSFVLDNYHADVLTEQPAGVWMSMFRLWRADLGRLRVRQVLATDKYHVVVLMESERGTGYYLHDLAVEEDYPHRITQFVQQALE
jgi:hypothetical protein